MAEQRQTQRRGRRPGPTTTRDAVLRAARRQFAHTGYDRATFRSIAGEAGVDPALVVQFFGSKQELFKAATVLPLRPAEAISRLRADDPHAVGAGLARLVVAALEDPAGRAAIVARVRSAASEPAAALMVREMLVSEIADVARALGADEPDLRAALAGSQLVGLVMARHVVGVEPLAALEPERLARVLAPTLQRYLVDPLES